MFCIMNDFHVIFEEDIIEAEKKKSDVFAFLRQEINFIISLCD